MKNIEGKKEFEQQLGFFAAGGLLYALPITVGITLLLAYLVYPTPLQYPTESLVLIIMFIVDGLMIKTIFTKK
ncbi:MAG: hypothetical protein ACRCZG_03925 [Culicoidibacterales bacterium]